MRFSRIARKKRKVPLFLVHKSKKKPTVMSQWRPNRDDILTRENNWFRSVLSSHDSFCGCGDPILHFSRLAASANLQGGPPSPPNPSPSRGPAIRGLPALPAPPGPPTQRRRHTATENPRWLGGGGGDGEGGHHAGDGDGAGGDDFQGDALEELVDLLDEPE